MSRKDYIDPYNPAPNKPNFGGQARDNFLAFAIKKEEERATLVEADLDERIKQIEGSTVGYITIEENPENNFVTITLLDIYENPIDSATIEHLPGKLIRSAELVASTSSLDLICQDGERISCNFESIFSRIADLENQIITKADKVGELPYYTVKSTDIVSDFIESNRASVLGKTISIKIDYGFRSIVLIGAFTGSSGGHKYSFDFWKLESDFRLYAAFNGYLLNISFDDWYYTEAIRRRSELQSNKVTSLTDQSTNTEYPSAKAVYDYVSTESGKIDSISIDGVAQPIVDKNVDLPAYPTRTSLNIDNVDNTSDLDKPISTATQAALDLKSDKIETPLFINFNDYATWGALYEYVGNRPFVAYANDFLSLCVIQSLTDSLHRLSVNNSTGIFKTSTFALDSAISINLTDIRLKTNNCVELNADDPVGTLTNEQLALLRKDNAYIKVGTVLYNKRSPNLFYNINIGEYNNAIALEYYYIEISGNSYSILSSFKFAENKSHKVTSISSSSTDIQYPSAKAVYDFVKDEPNLIEITYSELKSLKDSGQLIPGRYYRITDYQCTTIQENTSSANHPFDIIVRADSTNKLNEEASAILHEGDTYFSSCKLEAWKLWYCLDNDTTHFAWADSTNGKGVIYRMIDEFNNDCPYDFKNILFTKSGSYTNAYTFSYTESSIIKDASLLLDSSCHCHGNVIKEYIDVNSDIQQLNFNVFYSRASYCSWRSNTFDTNCESNTFGNVGSYNTFGSGCSRNTFGDDFRNNTFGSGCSDNTFSAGHCLFNTFGNDCSSNTFGVMCCYNTFGEECYYNTFGNSCYYITFGDSSSTINYCQYNIVDNGCSYLYINGNGTASYSNQLQNIHIHLGVKGTTSNRKTITVDRGLSYTTDIYPISSTEIFI